MLSPALRTLGTCSPGILSAPMCNAAIVFMKAVGVDALLGWDTNVAREALAIYHEVCVWMGAGLLGGEASIVNEAAGGPSVQRMGQGRCICIVLLPFPTLSHSGSDCCVPLCWLRSLCPTLA